jgi:hypothetical protein
MKGADQLRAFAVGVNKFSVSDSFYPGVRMPMVEIYPMAIAKFYAKYITDFFSLDLKRVKKVASKFSLVTQSPDSLGLMQRIPHIDAASQNSLAMIHYLCDAPESGTALYRQKKTGFEFVDAARHERYLSCVNEQFSQPDIYPKGYICSDTPEYEQIASFPAVFNRLIMYRGSSLHSGIIGSDYSFDSSPATGRLTVTTFIEFHD